MHILDRGFHRTCLRTQNYTTVLEIILRLRQICNAASLCPKEPTSAAAAGSGAHADPTMQAQQLARLQELLEEGGLGECPGSPKRLPPRCSLSAMSSGHNCDLVGKTRVLYTVIC